MNREVFSKYDMMTVGEMSSTSIDHCILYTNPDRHELNMTFNFHHLKSTIQMERSGQLLILTFYS